MKNVDPQEIKKFDDMASDWWDPNGPCKPLHEINPLRFAFIQSCCSLINQHILDIGCGAGILTEALCHNSSHVIGIDQSAKALEAAEEHASKLSNISHKPRYIHVNAEDFSQAYPQQFDVITCMEMLEHVPDPISIIKACATLLKPGGHLFISTINRTPKAFLHAIIGAEYCLKMLPKGTHDYERFIRPSELASWARTCDLLLKRLKGISFRLFSKTYYLSEEVGVNYLAHFQKD